MDEAFWEEIREEFPVTKNLAYFQSAGMSPIPLRVLKAISESYQRISEYGDVYFLDDLKRGDELKKKLSLMINTGVENVTFSHNSSIAFTLVANALKKSMPFDFNIVSLQDEFPSTNIPFEFQGIPIKYVQPEKGIYPLDKILDAVDEKTMAVVLSHLQYSTGFRIDLQKLGKALLEMDLIFIVNATQSFPIYDIDVQAMNIDVMSVSFHKWGLSGVNGSLLYTSEGFRRSYPLPLAGWLSVVPPDNDFIPTQKNHHYEQFATAAQYNFGTINYQTLAGLDAAIDLMNEIGRDRIRDRIHDLTNYLINQLKQIPVEIISPVGEPSNQSSIILVNIPGASNAEAIEFLHKNKIVTSLRTGKIRISVNFFNNFGEIDRLVEALALFAEM